MIRAVILAAGIGSRLAAVSNGKPKALAPVNGEAILLRNIRHLKAAGVTDITVVAGFEWARIRDALPQDVKLVVNARYAETNSIVSLACAVPNLRGGAFLMQNVDVLYSVGLLRRMLLHPAANACLVDADREYSPDEYRISVNHQGRITQYAKGLREDETVGESAQLLKVGSEDSDAFLDRVEEIAQSSGAMGFPLQAYPVLQEGQGLCPVYTAGLPWWEIDKPEDLRKCEETFASELARISPAKVIARPLSPRVFVKRLLGLVLRREMPWRLELSVVALHACAHHPLRALRWYPRLWNQTLRLAGYRLQVYGPSILKEVVHEAAKFDITLMAGWGTLLGLIRDNGFILGDHDIDLMIHERDAAKLLPFKTSLLKRGYIIRFDNSLKLSLIKKNSNPFHVDIDVIRDEGSWYTIVNNTAEPQREFHYRFSRKVFDGNAGSERFPDGTELATPPGAVDFLREVYGQWEMPAEKLDYRCAPMNVHVVCRGALSA